MANYDSDKQTHQLTVVNTTIDEDSLILCQDDINNPLGVVTPPNIVAQTTLDDIQEGGTAKKVTAAEKTSYDNHIANTTTNPHSVTKSVIGLGSVDNTADSTKPISNPQQNALDLKSDTTHSHAGEYEPTDSTILRETDVDDVPVNGVTTRPISSNRMYDHENNPTNPHDGVYEPIDSAILRESDVDDVPVNGAIASPVSSNRMYDHEHDFANPHDVNKTDVGLSAVNNTTDANKPISDDTQDALDLKANQTAVDLKADISDLDDYVDKTASTGSANIPAGTTAQRPSGSAGGFRFNTTKSVFEGHHGDEWENISVKIPRKNILINGGLTVDQRGSNGVQSTAIITRDRWYQVYARDGDGESPSSGHYIQNSVTDHWILQLNPTVSIGNRMSLWQNVEKVNLDHLTVGDTMTISFLFGYDVTSQWSADAYLHVDISRASSVDNFGAVVPVHASVLGQVNQLPSDPTLYSYSFIVTQDMVDYGTRFRVECNTFDGNIPLGTGTTWYPQFGQIQAEMGEDATPFEYKSYGEELALCEKYYQTSGNLPAEWSGNTDNGGGYFKTVYFKTKMHHGPSLVLTYVDAYAFPTTDPALSQSEDVGFRCNKIANLTATGGLYRFSWIAIAEI